MSNEEPKDYIKLTSYDSYREVKFEVTVDTNASGFLDHLFPEICRFLLGCGYQRESIDKYINDDNLDY